MALRSRRIGCGVRWKRPGSPGDSPEGAITVKKVFVKRSILCATAVSMFASAMVKASISLAMG